MVAFGISWTKPVRSLIVALIFLSCSIAGQTITAPTQVDEFGPLSNDDLLARVHYLDVQLKQNNSLKAIAIISGNSWERQVNLLRLRGCHRWLQIPLDRISFFFDSESEVKVEFWVLPNGMKLAKSNLRPTDYDLSDLTKPVELSTSQSLEEYCPRYVDVNLYSRYLAANPTFNGKVVIDTSRKHFVARVSTYRKQLRKLGITESRIRFYRKHFYHEHDEQWWLMPPKRK